MATRQAARDSWLRADGDLHEAVRLMRLDPRAAGCGRPDRMILRWGRDNTNRDSLTDLPRSGRPRQLTKAATIRAAAILKAGYTISGVHKCYSSFKHACSQDEELQSILITADVTRKHLLACIGIEDPSAVFGMLHVKNAFTLSERRGRIKDSKKMLRNFSRAATYSQRIFWIDAKKMHVSLASQKVWFDSTDQPDTVEDVRAQGARGGLKTLHFYAAVNACKGPVALIFVTGTTGLQRDPAYRVRRHDHIAGHVVCYLSHVSCR